MQNVLMHIEATYFGHEFTIVIKVRCEWFAKNQQDVNVIQKESIGSNWFVRNHLFFVVIQIQCMSHPFQYSIFSATFH